MKKSFGLFSPETLILAFFPLAGIGLALAFFVSAHPDVASAFSTGHAALLYYLRVGSIGFMAPFLVAVLVFTFLIFNLKFFSAGYRRGGADAQERLFAELKNFAMQFGALMSYLLLSFLFFGTVINLFFFAVPLERVSRASRELLMLDYRMFGVYPMFWFQDSANSMKYIFDFLTPVFLTAYRLLTPVITIAFFGLLAADERKFRIFLLAFFLNIFFALPVWYAVPAETPNDAFVQKSDTIAFSFPGFREATQRYAPNVRLQEVIAFYKAKPPLAIITTMPSMHVAWGLTAALAVYGWQPWLGVILFLWSAVNDIATVYLLQHYVVDVVAGILFGAVSFFVADRWLVFDENAPFPHGGLTAMIQHDMQFFVSSLRRVLHTLLGWRNRHTH